MTERDGEGERMKKKNENMNEEDAWQVLRNDKAYVFYALLDGSVGPERLQHNAVVLALHVQQALHIQLLPPHTNDDEER